MQEKVEEAMVLLEKMKNRAVMAETILEATLQYQSGQLKALSSPRYMQLITVRIMCSYNALLKISDRCIFSFSSDKTHFQQAHLWSFREKSCQFM